MISAAKHGAIGYRHGCRCDTCRTAITEQIQARHAENARVEAMITAAKITLAARLERSGR